MLAAALAVIGCVLGNFLAAVLVESIDHQIPVIEILSSIPAKSIGQFILSDLSLIDLMFWIVAVSAAAWFAKRRLTRQEGLAIFTLRHGRPRGAETL